MRKSRDGPGVGGLGGRIGLAPEPSGQIQGPALRARLPEAYPTCPLPRQSSMISQAGHSQKGSGSCSWPGQLQKNWVKSTKKASGDPSESLGLRKGLGRDRLLLVSLLWP